MTTVLDGPLHHPKPIPVNIGEDFVLQVPSRDGEVTAERPHGALQSVAAATKKGILRVYQPDGSTNVTRDTSVSGEGEKVADAGSGTEDSYRFLVAGSVTTGWVDGLRVAWEVEHQDSSTTPPTARLISTGWLEIRRKPSASGVAAP